jgi:hypothetical protein
MHILSSTPSPEGVFFKVGNWNLLSMTLCKLVLSPVHVIALQTSLCVFLLLPLLDKEQASLTCQKVIGSELLFCIQMMPCVLYKSI